MARARSQTRTRSNSVDSRLVEIETTLTKTLEALPNAIKVAVTEGLRDVEQVFRNETNALAARVAALELARAGGVGAASVRNDNRTQLQEWARTLFPYALAAIAAALGLEALR